MPKSYINSEKFEKAAQLAEFLMEEIDEEIAHESFSKSPNTGIRLQEPEAIDMGKQRNSRKINRQKIKTCRFCSSKFEIKIKLLLIYYRGLFMRRLG